MLTSKFIRTDNVVDAINWKFDSINTGPAGATSRSVNSCDEDHHEDSDFQRGLKQGLSDGFRAGVTHEQRQQSVQLCRSTAILDEVVASMQLQFTSMENGVAQALTDMAFAIARQVIRADLVVNPDSIADITKEALTSLAERAMHPVIWLNPSDASQLPPAVLEILTVRGCRIEHDMTISRGGCRVESDSMTIDATLETRWQQALASIGYAAHTNAMVNDNNEHVATNY